MRSENIYTCQYTAKMGIKSSGKEIEIIDCMQRATHQEIDNPHMKFCEKHAGIISEDGIKIEKIPI